MKVLVSDICARDEEKHVLSRIKEDFKNSSIISVSQEGSVLLCFANIVLEMENSYSLYLKAQEYLHSYLTAHLPNSVNVNSSEKSRNYGTVLH